MNRGGTTPVQLVFGQLPRVPAELLSDDHPGLMALNDMQDDPSGSDQATAEFRKRMMIRERARQAIMSQASREAVQRAVKASTHHSRDFRAGQWVYVFRRGRPGDPLHPRDRWVGPGLIILANNSTVYVGMRTRLWRCSPEQLRMAHPCEELGYHLAHDSGMGELLRQVLSGTPKGAVNVVREGPPDDSSLGAPVDRSEEGVMLPRPLPVPDELRSAPRDPAPPVPPGLLLPPGLQPVPREPLQHTEASRDSSRRPSTVSEPAGEPHSLQEPLAGIPEGSSEDEASAEVPPGASGAREGDDGPVERPSKAPRLEDGGSRAPGTPVQSLMRGVAAGRAQSSRSSSEGAVSPGETVPATGRVERQVREWEQVISNRARDQSPDGDQESRDALFSFYQDGQWSGSFECFLRGAQPMTLDGAEEWTFAAKRNDEVDVRKLAKEEQELFEASDLLEWQSILKTGAVKVLTGKEADEARQRYPTRILSSRMVRRKKPVPGIGRWKAKRRWCVHGHADPDTGSLVTYSPTPASESLMLFLQASLNLRHRRAYADVKNAFCQSRPIRRPRGPIFAEPCSGLSLPEGAIIQIVVPVYGLDDALVAWRETVSQYLVEEAGFTRNLVEPCWFSRFVPGTRLCDAMVMVEVDDFIVSAEDGKMNDLKDSMQARFVFGKWEEGSAEYAGRLITDCGDHLEVSQEKYVVEQVHPMILSKDRKKSASEQLSESEFEQFRSLIFKLNWLGRETRPEAAGVASIMASRLQAATIQDVMTVNRFVNHLRNTASRPLRIWQLDPTAMVFLMISDAGGVNSKQELTDDEGLPADTTQGAWMVLTAETFPEGDRRVKASPMAWRSSKLKRKVFSTFGGETQAMLQGVNEVEWLQILYRDAVFGDIQS